MSQFPLLRFLAVLFVLSTGTAVAQSLADVLSSLQERQRAVGQSYQVAEYLAGLGGSTPTISDQELIEWTGIGSVDFPAEADLAATGIDGRVALLNQAVSEFKRLQRSYLNLRAEDVAAASHLGTLRHYMREDFPDLGRADASNYHAVLSQLAQQIIRLRVLPWPVAGIRQYQRFGIGKHEEVLRNAGGTMTGIVVVNDEGSASISGWEPAQIGPGVEDDPPSTDWRSTLPSGVLSEVVYTRNHFISGDDVDAVYGLYTLRSLDAYMVGLYFSDAMLPASVPGDRTDQIGGKVALLSHSLWTPAKSTDYTASADWNNQDAGYTVQLAVTNSTGSESLDAPVITLNLQWFDGEGSTASSTSRWGLPSGFSDYKHHLEGGTSADWAKSWEKFSFDDLRDPIVLHRHLQGVAAPNFEKGLNSGSKASALAAAAKYSRPPTGDAVPELSPAPGMLLGIPIGVGMEGNAEGWLGWSPSDILFHSTPVNETPGFVNTEGSSLIYPFSVYGTARLIRFDHAANLRFIGPAQDFHVVYETSRTGRGASIPTSIPTTSENEASGWNGINVDDSTYPPYWKDHFFAAWETPRLRQVVSREFIVDVTSTGHYSSEIKIYRRSLSAGAVDRTPGHLETPEAGNLVRTLVCSNPEAGTAALPAVAEHLQVADGSNNYEVWRDGLEASYSPSTQALHFRMTEGSTVKWSKVIDFPEGLDARITTTLDSCPPAVDELSGAWPYGDVWGGGHIGWNWWESRSPLSFKRTSDGKVIEITNTIDEESAGSQNGAYPASSLIKYPDTPDLSIEWKNSGLVDFSEQGVWRTDYTLPSLDSLKSETKLGSATVGNIWTDWDDGGRKVKTYGSPTGTGSKGSSETGWSELEYGNSTGTGLPGLAHMVRHKDGNGATYAWGWLSPSDTDQLTLSEGLLADDTVSRGTRIVTGVNQRGQPTGSATYLVDGTTLQTAGSVMSDFNAWGMPEKSTSHNTGLESVWTYSPKLNRLASATSPLGLTTTFTGYDAFDRVGNIATNGINATITHSGFSTTSNISGDATGSITDTRDALGRLTASDSTWNGVIDNLAITPGGSSTGITRETLLGTYQSSVRKDDGSIATASGPTLPFGGNEGTSLSVEGGLIKTTATLLDHEGSPTDTFQTTWTDAWGRIRKTTTPSASGGGTDETQTLYSDPDSSLKRVRTTDAAGRTLITESDPYNSSGAIRRSGIDVNGNGTLGASDRYVESVTTVSGGSLVTTLKLTEDSGLREILRSTWTPEGNVTVTKINDGEETITRTPNYTAKTVTTSSNKGWEKSEAFNNLALTTNSTLSGTGIPSAELNPTWRADGSLDSVSLTIDGEVHSATFNNDGTLATLTAPGRGNILGGHSIAAGVETLTVDGVTTVTKLDGTEVSTSGGDGGDKSDALVIDGSGFKHTTTPAVGAATEVVINAAGAPTAKNYAAGVGEGYTHTDGGLLTSITLARGGSLAFGYSNDGAKDLSSAAWPEVSSGAFTIPAVAQGYGYDRAGRLKEIGDSSGVRAITYANGRLAETVWNSGPLAGYKVVRSHDASGRETGFTLYRGNVVIHSASKASNDVSGEISALICGDLKVVIGRNGARQITGFEWGNATGTFSPTVTQTWERGTNGRILSASSNVSGAASFDYRGSAHNEASAFDAKGRRLKCATAGDEWTYAYTNGMLTSAVHPTLGSFTYQFDGIGRRTDKGSSNTTDLLNRTLAWTNIQNKTVKITAHPDARVWFNGMEIPSFTGSYNYPVPSPGASGGWVPWNTLAVLEGQGDAGANADAKAEQSGAVWIPPTTESFTYDAAGNRESSALWDYGWDAKNELVHARTKGYNTPTTPQGYDVTNAYDAEGRRFSKKVNRYQNGSIVEQKVITFIHDGNDLIYERQQLPSGLTTLERKYVWGPDIANSAAGGAGGLLLIQETKGDTTTDLYPLYDGSGNIISLTDSIGTLQAEYAYGPFGERIYARGPHADSCPFRFATKYWDDETGLYNFGKRFLDPITGQWLSREILGESESINLYSYCGNNPIGNVDRLGLEAVAVEAALNNGIPTMIYEEWAGSGLAYLWNALAAGKVKTWGQSPNGGELKRLFYFEDGAWHLRSEGAARNAGMDEALAGVVPKMNEIAPVMKAAEIGGAAVAMAPFAALAGSTEVGAGIYAYGSQALGSIWVQAPMALVGTQAAYDFVTDESVRQDTIGAIASDPNGVRATGELLGAGVSGLARMGPRVASLWEAASEGLFPAYGRAGFAPGKVINPFYRLNTVGRTPGKASATGRMVIERMRAEGAIMDDPIRGILFESSDGNWYPMKLADMSHKKDAVTWWNSTGRLYGPKSSEVRRWMLDPDNYVLDFFKINRSSGAILGNSGARYLPPD